MDDVRQLIDGKLGEMGHNPRNTRAILEEGDSGTSISLQDADRVFLPPAPMELERSRTPSETGEGGSAGELADLREALCEATDRQGALQEEVAKLKEVVPPVRLEKVVPLEN